MRALIFPRHSGSREAAVRNPETRGCASGFRARELRSRPGMTVDKQQTSAIVPAPALFLRVRGILPSQPSLQKSEGTGAPLGASVFRLCLSSRRGALRSAPVRRFLGPGRAFREAAQAQTSPSASSSRRLVVAGGGAPRPSRVRGCEPRPRAPLPIPRQARLQDAPLVDRDARIVTPPEEPGISFAKNFRIEIV